MLLNPYLTANFFIDGQTWKDCHVSFGGLGGIDSRSGSISIGGVYQVKRTELKVTDDDIRCSISDNPPACLNKAIFKVYKAYVNHEIIRFSETTTQTFQKLKQEISELKFDLTKLEEISFSDFPKESLKQLSFIQRQIQKKVYREALKNKNFHVNNKPETLEGLPYNKVEIKVINLLGTFFNSYLEEGDFKRAQQVLKKISFTQIGAESTFQFLQKFFNKSTSQSMGECLDRLNKVIFGHRPTKLVWQKFLENNREAFGKQVLSILPYIKGKEMREALIKEFSVDQKDITELAQPTERMLKQQANEMLRMIKIAIKEKEYDLALMLLDMEKFDDNTKHKYKGKILALKNNREKIDQNENSEVTPAKVTIKSQSLNSNSSITLPKPQMLPTRPLQPFYPMPTKPVAPVIVPSPRRVQPVNYSNSINEWPPFQSLNAPVVSSPAQQIFYSKIIEDSLKELEQKFQNDSNDLFGNIEKLRGIYKTIKTNFGLASTDSKVQGWMEKVNEFKDKFNEMGVYLNLDC